MHLRTLLFAVLSPCLIAISSAHPASSDTQDLPRKPSHPRLAILGGAVAGMGIGTIGNLARRRFEYHVDHFLHQIPGIGRFFIPEVADPHSIEYLDLSEVGDPRDPHRKQLEHCVRLKWWTATRSKRLGVWTDRWEEWNRCIRDPKNGIPAGESTIAVRPRPRPFGQYYPPTATDQPPQDRFSSSLHALEHRAARAWSSTTRHLEAGVSRASSQLALAAGQSKGAGRTAMVAARTAQGIDRLEYAAGHL